MQYSKKAILVLAVLSPAFTSSLALPRVAVRDSNAVSVQDAPLVSRHLPGAMPVKLRSRHGGGGATGESEETGGLSGTGGQCSDPSGNPRKLTHADLNLMRRRLIYGGDRNRGNRHWRRRDWDGRDWDGRDWDGRDWDGRDWQRRDWDGRGRIWYWRIRCRRVWRYW